MAAPVIVQTPGETAPLRWFRRIVWAGIAMNLAFIGAGLLMPAAILSAAGLAPQSSTVWIGNAAMLLLCLSLMYVPVAMHPGRWPVFSWLAVLARFIAVAFWATVVGTTPGLLGYLAGDLLFGLAELALLQTGLPAADRIGAATPGRLWTALREHFAATAHSRFARVVTVLVVVLAAGLGAAAWYTLLRAQPDTQFPTGEEQFEHGAIGLPTASRVPYILWATLPDLFPDKLPGGWASLGFAQRPGQALPVGFSMRNIGFPQVEPNCALCHTSQYRTRPNGPVHIVPGGPANQLQLERFQWFLYNAASDPRFTASNILNDYQKKHPLNFLQRAAYRMVILPFARYGLLQQKQEYGWQLLRPPQGPGRTDTFNPTKIVVFHMPDDGTIGTTDFPQVWNQRPRIGMHLHWDGNNDDIHERNYAAAMAIGATPKSVIQTSFNRVTNFLLGLQPPKFPFPIDAAKAARGQVIYQRECASCHAFGGAKTGTVTAIGVVGTDPHRLNSFTQALVTRFHSIDNPPFVFNSYEKTHGYANVPLDGIWLRGPYLHNGSVPTLWDLLQTPDQRPTSFYRGDDVIDPVHVGFVSDGPAAAKNGFFYDSHVAGNSNAGHLWGTELTDTQKWDLIEYLKTL